MVTVPSTWQGPMRILVLMMLSIAVSRGGVVAAQGEPAAPERADDSPTLEPPEEVVVRGRRLTDLRSEVQMAREQAYAIFNQINSNDDFDVYCRDEGRTGTRVTQRVCRAQFENRISAAAATEYMRALSWVCPPGQAGAVDTQACMFSNYASGAKSAAQGVEGQAPSMRDQMNEEILRLANQDERFAQAILEWYEAKQEYEAARRRRND